jgi:type I restriction enzyme, S subunit
MSLPRYPAYKTSGVEWLGEVPEHWDVTALKHGYVVTLGKMLQPEAVSEGDMLLPYLRAANIRWSGVDGSDIKTMWFSARDRDHLRLKFGDLLVSEGGDVGRSALWKGEVDECYFQNSVNRVRPSNGNLTSFLRYWMSTMKDKGFIDVLCNKSTIAHFTAEKVGAVPVPLPPADEQHAIVSFLDHETAKIDALIAEQRRLIELLQEKRQAVISHAVTKGLNPDAPMKDSGVEWLGEVPEHWEVTRLKYITTPGSGIQMGPYGGMLVDLQEQETGFKLYGQENTISGDLRLGQRWLSPEHFLSLSGYHIHDGDILLTRKGSLGNAMLVKNLPYPGAIDSDTVRVRVLEGLVHSSILVLLLHEAEYIKEQLSRHKRGAILPGLNTDVITNLCILLPPLAEQVAILRHIHACLDEFLVQLGNCERVIRLLQERRSALISAAVTGQIDVRGLVPEAEAA